MCAEGLRANEIERDEGMANRKVKGEVRRRHTCSWSVGVKGKAAFCMFVEKKKGGGGGERGRTLYIFLFSLITGLVLVTWR
jgi:hypothetical protein